MPPTSTRRVYYYTPPKFALENLKNHQIVVSRVNSVNDPFEMEAVNFKDREFRKRYIDYRKKELAPNHGFVSFSRSWQISIMWSHYAKIHTGLCLAFDVNPEVYFDIRYTQERLFPGITNATFFDHIGEDQLQDLFGTKHTHWAYEEEVRTIVDLSKHKPDENGRHFFGFGNDIKLKKVYLGPDTYWGKQDVVDAIQDKSIPVTQTRRAFQHFNVVRQRNQKLWKLRANKHPADDIIAHLNLSPHPEGGHYRQTWVADNEGRASGTCIYFLLKADEVSHWHRVDATEIWHFYAGAPLVLSMAETSDGPRANTLLGPDLAAGQHLQIIVPENHWQLARTTGAYTLVGCTVSPGF